MQTYRLTSFIALVLFAISLSGCSSSYSPSNIENNGVLTGELSGFPDSNLIIQGEHFSQSVRSNNMGNFSISLPEGRYKLYLKTDTDKLVLIKEDLVIENNLSIKITDVQLIPVPTVTSVSVPLIYDTSVIIEWKTDIESDGYIEYGTNELYGFSSFAGTELKRKHQIQLYDLMPGTTYHFRIIASRYSLESTSSKSKDFSFTTEL